MPLTVREHARLIHDADATLLRELREKYANDGIAQQQIDTYDDDSPYSEKWNAYTDAIINNDEQAKAKIAAWMRRRYPDVWKE